MLRVPNMSGRSVKEKMSSGRGCQIDRPTLKPSSLASVKAKNWKVAVKGSKRRLLTYLGLHPSRTSLSHFCRSDTNFITANQQ